MVVTSLLLAVGLTAVQLTVPSSVQPASALSTSDFDPGNIISDASFFDGAAMSEADIQAFLEAKVGACKNENCLAVLRVASQDRGARATGTGTPVCRAYQGSANESAAAVIFKVQQACGISARVILVTLQKEQALITKSFVSAVVLQRAMGYGCPDTTGGTCASEYEGFFNQVYWAAWQLKRYGASPVFGAFQPGQESIQWHPNAGCGTKSVRIENRATAALYNYTPYVPNTAALSTLSGLGDQCSSYGNRNFWVFYNNWFGPTTLKTGSPVGEIKELWVDSGSINMWGWAFDPTDTKATIPIHLLVDGAWKVWTANASNVGSELQFPGSGSNHGFGGTISVAPGSHRVCAYAVNQGLGENLLLGCRDVVVPDGSPAGELKDLWTTANAINFWGWAVDRDAFDKAVQLHVRANGAWFVFNANAPYASAAQIYPGAGANVGFGGSITLPAGPTNVCLYAVNTGKGSNTTLGCRDLVVPDGSPVGQLKDMYGVPGGVAGWGWAADGDAVGATVDIHVRVGASSWAVLRADQEYKPAIGLAPRGGMNHGWGGTIAAPPGTQQACAWAVNAGAGLNLPLGCRTVTVPGGPPIGAVGGAFGTAGGVGIWGWALDPDTTAPINVHILVDNTWFAVVADAENPAVLSAYPAYGGRHGFGRVLPVAPGEHRVCSYAVNTGVGVNTTLACSTVTVP